jgi:hypothetical protein
MNCEMPGLKPGISIYQTSAKALKNDEPLLDSLPDSFGSVTNAEL